jgi:hypothetical protein
MFASFLVRMINDYIMWQLEKEPSKETILNGTHARMWLYEEAEYDGADNSIQFVCDMLGCDSDWVLRKVEGMVEDRAPVNEHLFGRVVRECFSAPNNG